MMFCCCLLSAHKIILMLEKGKAAGLEERQVLQLLACLCLKEVPASSLILAALLDAGRLPATPQTLCSRGQVLG